jgi:LacI family transcriptional regulator
LQKTYLKFYANYAKLIWRFIISVMEVTLQDIANELDVSAATVSRSLRHDKLINPETRARVNEAAIRMGYRTRVRRPRRVVESDSRSRTLGLILRHNSIDTVRHDMNLMKMMSGIMAVTDAHRVILQMHSIHHDEYLHMAENSNTVPPIAQQGMCQVFIVHGDQDTRDIAFLAERAPVVSMGRNYRALPINAVVGDNIEGVRTMVTHLVELGHRRLGWVDNGIPSSFMQARQAGFIQGCLEHHLEFNPYYMFGPELYQQENIKAKNGLLAALETGVTGFICGNDNIAYQMITLLESVGQRVPDDVSVMAFDATSNSTDSIHISGIDPHFFEIGQLTAQLAIQRISHASSIPCVMSVRGEFVQGTTTASAP